MVYKRQQVQFPMPISGCWMAEGLKAVKVSVCSSTEREQSHQGTQSLEGTFSPVRIKLSVTGMTHDLRGL